MLVLLVMYLHSYASTYTQNTSDPCYHINAVSVHLEQLMRHTLHLMFK